MSDAWHHIFSIYHNTVFIETMFLTDIFILCLIGDKHVDGLEAERKKLLAQFAVRIFN